MDYTVRRLPNAAEAAEAEQHRQQHDANQYERDGVNIPAGAAVAAVAHHGAVGKVGEGQVVPGRGRVPVAPVAEAALQVAPRALGGAQARHHRALVAALRAAGARHARL